MANDTAALRPREPLGCSGFHVLMSLRGGFGNNVTRELRYELGTLPIFSRQDGLQYNCPAFHLQIRLDIRSCTNSQSLAYTHCIAKVPPIVALIGRVHDNRSERRELAGVR